MNPQTCQAFFKNTAARIALLIVYIISVNLLAGYIAVWPGYPTLWGGGSIFIDYAMPLGLTWALSHWPSLVLISIPLLLMPTWNAIWISRFRMICICLFIALLYGVIEKIPFALFPAVDLLTAFFFSLVVAPPTYNENPVLTVCLAIFFIIIALVSVYTVISIWQHRTPAIKETDLMDGLFHLKSIEVNSSYKKELIFTVELKQPVSQDDVCIIASEMGEHLFQSYPFDNKYNKFIEIIFNPDGNNGGGLPYPLGEVSQYENDGKVAIECYLKFK